MNLREKILLDLEKNPVLKTGFFENENRWNNTFNFSQKFSFKKFSHELKNFSFDVKKFFKTKKIFIPGIKIWNFEDLKFWNKIVFEDFDEIYEDNLRWKKELIQETWFESHLWILDYENNWEKFPPIFICDNHNHVLESWKFFKWEKTKLIHIDQHKDFADYQKPVKNYKRDLRICDYIKYTIDEKWINDNYISLCENIDFNKYFELNWEADFFSDNKNYSKCEDFFLEFEKKFLQKKYINWLKKWEEKIILNIDLDIFVKHQTMINHKKLFELIKFLKSRVDLISIASSPLFLEKSKVLDLIQKILKGL